MSLRWDISEVADYEDVCFVGEGDERRLSGVTESLIWLTMGVDLGSITEKNAAEFYARVSITEALNGPMLRTPDGPRNITPEEVRAHIGLTTNVSDVTFGKWITTRAKYRKEDAEREYKRAIEKTAAAV